MQHSPRCVAIFGRTGSGKSTYAKKMVNDPARQALVVFDPQAEYHLPQFRDLSDLKDAMRNQWQRGFKLSYVPEGDPIVELHRLSDLIWQVQAPYQAGRMRRELSLFIDEANLGYPARGLPNDARMIERVTLQGRHRGINMVCISQRPPLVSPNYRGQVGEWVIFPLSTKADRKAITENIGEQYEPQITGLKDHQCLIWRQGQVQIGHN